MPHKSTAKSYPSRPGHPGKSVTKPAEKALPAQASDTAHTRAFGQQGLAARMKAGGYANKAAAKAAFPNKAAARAAFPRAPKPPENQSGEKHESGKVGIPPMPKK